MRVVILTYGSRGDVQPYLALARALQDVGCQVRVAAPAIFGSLAVRHGIALIPLAGDPTQVTRDLADRAGRSPLRTVRTMAQHTFPLAVSVLHQAREASRDADVVIHSFLFAMGGHVIARELGVPDLAAQVLPVFAPTGDYPCPAFPHLPQGTPRWLQTPYNRMTHIVFERTCWWANRLAYRWIVRPHSPDIPRRPAWPFARSVDPPTPVLLGYSARVLPRPIDWAPHLYVTGYWDLAPWTDDPPTDRVRAFVENGPPPVCIGFGSMAGRLASHTHQLVRQALRLTGQRGLLLSGWTELQADTPSDDLLTVREAPHAWLFPRCAAIVHHGGAGTTAAALRSGQPSIVIPFAADQPFWAERVRRLGVGPPPIAAASLTSQKLAGAIDSALHDRSLQQRARSLGQALQTEDGAREAARIICCHD